MLQKLDEGHINRLKVADYLNDLDPKDFHMGSCYKCICGHVTRVFIGTYTNDWGLMKESAAKYLGITDQQANELFAPGNHVYGDSHSDITPDPRDAARVMRYLAATDTVDWSVGKRAYKPSRATDPMTFDEGGDEPVIGYAVLEEDTLELV